MPPLALAALKVAFLVLLYLFVWRTVRSSVVDLRAASPPRPAAAVGPPASSRRRSRAPRRLVLVDERGRRSTAFSLEGTLQVGRAEACHVRLVDSYTSQFHARVFARDGAWFVEDLNSTNGTFLNERKVTSAAELHPGDRLRLGRTVLEVRA